MLKVVFVGDKPSHLNINTDIAFVGARCFNTVVQWIKYIKPDYYVCLNSNSRRYIQDIYDLHTQGFKVIALGNKASERLSNYKYSIHDTFEIPHLKIDHPSGLNRKLNDKSYVEKQLQKAYDYVRR